MAGIPLTRRLLVALALLPAWAFGGSVYLNGVNIDGLTDVKFEKTTVRIDAQGNVLIDAPHYKVVQDPSAARPPPPPPQQPAPVVAAPPPPPPQPSPVQPASATSPARITKRYWLVVKQTAPGMTEYNVDVYLNAKWLMTVQNGMYDDAVNITRHLKPGQNTVVFEAKKVATGARKSFSAEHAMSLVIGEGDENSGNVMVDNALVSFRRTAQDADNTAREYSFVAR